jgi:hypothetical protein
MKHGVVSPEQIDQTLEFWRRRTARQLTNEDARQITVNMTRFFEILAEWDERDRKRRSPKPPRRRSRRGLEFGGWRREYVDYAATEPC